MIKRRDTLDAVRVRILPDGRMNRENAARYLGLKPKTLAQWVTCGEGPRMVRVGGRIFYFKADLDAFVKVVERPTSGGAPSKEWFV